MSIHLKNKSSQLNILVSSSILQLLIMGLLSYLILNALFQHQNRTEVALVELTDTHSTLTKEEVIETLKSFGNSISSMEIIDKEAALELMSKEFSEDINFGTLEGNPFKDIIQFEFDTQQADFAFGTIKEKLEIINGVAGVFTGPSAAVHNGILSQAKWSKLFFVLIFLVIIIMAYIYYASKSSEFVTNNKDVIHSLSIYGSRPTYIKSLFKTYLFNISFKAWMMSLVLFFLCFYLLLAKLGMRISEIGHSKLIIVLILPLMLTYVINYMLINSKLNRAIENI